MGITLPTFGQLNWHTPLNAALNEIQSAAGLNPEDFGLINWNYPVYQCTGNGSPTSGTVRTMRLAPFAVTTTITSVALHVVTAQITGTAGQNFVGLYDVSGNRVAVSADATTAFSTIGDKIIPLTAPYAAAPGLYWVGILTNGGTPPAFALCSSLSATVNNFNTAAALFQFANGPAGQTTLPASIVMGSRTGSTLATWVGVA